MGIRRQNPFLEEIIEELDQHLARCAGNTSEALESLSKADNDWIDGELIHCMADTRYFLSNYYAIKTEDEGYKGLYPFWDSQEILYESFMEQKRRTGRVKKIVDKARQMGGSTFVSGYVFAETIFTEHINSIVVAQDGDQTTYILDMYSAALDFLPWWIRPRLRYYERGKFMDFDEKDNAMRDVRPGLKTRLYGDNGNKPTGAGRGKTFKRAHLDELAFWMNPTQLTKALFPTMNSADGIYVMISTPNGRNDAWHNLWRRAEAGKIDWEPLYIPFYRREKTYSLPIPKGEKFELTDEEMAMRQQVLKKENHFIKDEVFNWRRKKIEEFIATDGDDKMFQQEYSSTAEESFQTSAITAFPRGIINHLSKRTINPRWIGEVIYDFKRGVPKFVGREVDPEESVEYPETQNRFHIWEKPVQGESYVMGIDVSLGQDGGDYSCVQVLKLSKGIQKDMQVACWHGLIDPESLATVVFAIGWMYNEALAAVEVNSMGMVTNNYLLRQLEYENVYRFKRLDRLKNFMTDIVGWWTDEKSKRALMAKMSKTLLDDVLDIPDKYTVDEFYDFTEDGAEGEGAHDDFLMALLIALYCGTEGEYKEIRDEKKPTAGEDGTNTFEVRNRFDSIVATTTSQNEAQRIAKKHIGSVIHRVNIPATANIRFNGKKAKVPADFQNTDWSPIHDGDGTAHDLFYEEGMRAEEITPEAIQAYEAEMEAAEEDPNAWLYQ